MSHWRWTPCSNFNPRVLRLRGRGLAAGAFPLFLLVWSTWAQTQTPARADDASSVSAGPVSAQEAKILWQDGKSAFDHGLDEDAIPKLERFVARYPGYPEYLEARYLLARAYMKIGEPAKAKPELQAFIQTQGRSDATLAARNLLCRVDLALKQYSEALLTANEVIRLTDKTGPKARQAEALTLRATAQLGLNQDERATDSLASALKALPSPAPAPLAGEAHELELELKLRHCLQFPSDEKLEEAQVRDQLGRRGSCLLESLNLFKTVLTTGDPSSSDRAEELVTGSYSSYWKKCLHPPEPPRIRPKDRDAQQLKTYFRELAVVLEEDCRQKIHQGLDLIRDWRGDPSTPSRVEDTLKKASAELEKLK